jgi:hypothetical protein
MSPLAVCTTLYPAGLPYLDDYCHGLAVAAKRYPGPLHLVLICDDLDESAFADQAQDLRRCAELHLLFLTDAGPAAARRLMLSSAATLPVVAVVCYDMDDIPGSTGLSCHMNALQTAEISYGDMDLIDAKGGTMDGTFFSGRHIPDRVDDPSGLLCRNFMGFTNTAVRREIIEPVASAIPDDITAVDWWFYTSLLIKGYSAARTDGAVVAYRTHDQNTLGAAGALDDETLLRQCRIMREHYAHLPSSGQVARADQAVERLMEMPVNARAALRGTGTRSGVWYDDVFRACKQMDAQA